MPQYVDHGPREERELFWRIVCGLLWFIPFLIMVRMVIGIFIAGTMGSGEASTFGEGYQYGVSQSAEFYAKYGRTVFLGTIFSWLILCYIGFFPGTGRFKKSK